LFVNYSQLRQDTTPQNFNKPASAARPRRSKPCVHEGTKLLQPFFIKRDKTPRRRWLHASLLCMMLLPGTLATPADIRHEPLKDLNGYFPFSPPADLDSWEIRRDLVRKRLRVALGLWPTPSRTPLNAVEHGTIDRGDHTVSKVFFESLPGFFVTGNLYRPKEISGLVPAVLFPHGHLKDARLAKQLPAQLRQQIANGEERFEQGGQSRHQSLCVQLARMGCVVWHWDMLGDSDSQQLSRTLIHGFKEQRPGMNAADGWGLFSTHAELRLQHAMGLQAWNSIRSLDFVMSLPEVDPDRIAVTGASGGGTQTMILAAVDDRIKLSYPVVMVSTAMQGGCTCENACLLRIGTGNVEFAASFAPKPQGMNTADDWTVELATKGFPELKQLYGLYGAANQIALNRGEQFPHNYNAVTRSAFFTFLNKQFRLGFENPVIEDDYEPLPAEALTVWDADHPAPPAADPDFEKNLLRWLAADSDRQVAAWLQSTAAITSQLRPAIETLIGRRFADAGDVDWQLDKKTRQGATVVMDGLLHNTTYGEQLPVRWLYPKDWSGDVVVWLDDGGLSAVFENTGGIVPPIQQLVAAGATVVAAEPATLRFLAANDPPQQRVVDNPREFAGYTFGYNQPVACQGIHDILTIVRYLRHGDTTSHDRPRRVHLVGLGHTAPLVVAARVAAAEAVDKVAADTGGFRFGSVTDYRHRLFIPGAVRFLDLPGFVAAGGNSPLLLLGEPGGGQDDFAELSSKLTGLRRIAKPAVTREDVTAWLLADDPATAATD
jgi:hypothetical protein